jgi:hypothetical protein
MVMKKIVLLAFASVVYFTLFSQRYPGNANATSEEKLNNEYCTGLFKTHDGTIIDLVNEMKVQKTILIF